MEQSPTVAEIWLWIVSFSSEEQRLLQIAAAERERAVLSEDNGWAAGLPHRGQLTRTQIESAPNRKSAKAHTTWMLDTTVKSTRKYDTRDQSITNTTLFFLKIKKPLLLT